MILNFLQHLFKVEVVKCKRISSILKSENTRCEKIQGRNDMDSFNTKSERFQKIQLLTDLYDLIIYRFCNTFNYCLCYSLIANNNVIVQAIGHIHINN